MRSAITHTLKKTAFSARFYSVQQSFNTAEEKHIYEKLKQSLNNPKDIFVQDVSGGCGSMYKIIVKSEQFNNLTMIKQHKLVNQILKEEIQKWHGLQLTTQKDL